MAAPRPRSTLLLSNRAIPLVRILSGLIFALGLGNGQHVVAQEDKPRVEGASPPPATAASASTDASGEPTSKSDGHLSEAGSPAARRIVEGPPLFYVRDNDGRLVPLLGFSYDEILKLTQQQKQDHQATEESSPYSLSQIILSGSTKNGHAELEASYKLRLLRAGWTELPLIGGGALLTDAAKYRGPGDHVVQFDPSTGAYRLRVRGDENSEHEVTLNLMVPLKTVGPMHQLNLELPAAAASRLSLDVGKEELTITEHAGAAVAEVARRRDGFQIEAIGLGGPLALEWKEKSASQSALVLEASGEILARVDSRTVQFDAALSVRSMSAPFKHLKVLLPPGAQLVQTEGNGAGYTVTTSGDAPQQVVEVELNQRTVGPVQIKLRAERAYDVTKPEPLELAGFQVAEAIEHRQWGHIGVVVQGDWQITWGKRERIQQVEELPETLTRKDLVAGFEYFGQPASLLAEIRPRNTRITVEPEYLCFVDANQLRLDGRLKYVIHGAKASALDIGLSGWQIDEIGPEALVNADAAITSADGTFRASLAKPASEEIELSFKAHRDLVAGATQIDFALPLAHADVHGAALLAIVPADNILLRPGEIEGLRRESSAIGMKLTTKRQPSLFYRTEQMPARFVGTLERLAQIVSARVESNLSVRQDAIEVDEWIHYSVEHEPLDTISLDVPRELLTPEANFRLQLDEQPLSFTQPKAPPADTPTVRLEVPVPGPRLGDFQIRARFVWPGVMTEGSSSAECNIALAMPQSVKLTSNSAIIKSDAGIRVEEISPPWHDSKSVSSAAAQDFTIREITTSDPATELTFNVTSAGARNNSTAVVDRAWLQTLVTATGRRQRVVYRFEHLSGDVQFSLPTAAQSESLELFVDNQRAAVERTAQNSYLTRLPGNIGAGHHSIDMRYWVDEAHSRLSKVEAQLPRLKNCNWIGCLYWQLILPKDQQLLLPSPALTAEYRWIWSGISWVRESALDQSQLEDWAGATHDAASLDHLNCYLFSTMSNPETLSAWSAARSQLVLVGSLSALTLGLILIYVPAIRKPYVLAALALAAIIACAWDCDAAILLAQSAVIGSALAIFAALLKYRVTRGRRVPVVARGSGSSVLRRSSARLSLRNLEVVGVGSNVDRGGSQISTAESEAASDA
jgi:hypothetical protein